MPREFAETLRVCPQYSVPWYCSTVSIDGIHQVCINKCMQLVAAYIYACFIALCMAFEASLTHMLESTQSGNGAHLESNVTLYVCFFPPGALVPPLPCPHAGGRSSPPARGVFKGQPCSNMFQFFF